MSTQTLNPVAASGFNLNDAFQRGLAAHQKGLTDEAARHYQSILALDPDHVPSLINLGVILKKQHDHHGAIALYARALALQPDSMTILSNLGNALLMHGRPEDALTCHQRFVEAEPESPEGHFNKALCLRALGKLNEAIFSFDRALTLCPDYVEAEWDRALTLLMAGDLYDGFAAYEARWRLPDTRKPRLSRPAWNGQDAFGKTILLYSEQGLGDTLQFVRYAFHLQRHLGANVVLHCQHELVGFLDSQQVLTAVNPYEEPLPAHDYQAPLMSLPYLMGLSEETLAEGVPYLRAKADVQFPFFSTASHKRKVGIVWAGRPTHKNDHNRSCSLTHFLPLLSLPDVRLYSLQIGARADDLRKHNMAGAIFDLSPSVIDFADTARLVEELDLVITVDTAVAHLAGAMGKPVWVLLPFIGDWRWGARGETCPWYPTARLFRQARLGDWHGVFENVIAALKKK